MVSAAGSSVVSDLHSWNLPIPSKSSSVSRLPLAELSRPIAQIPTSNTALRLRGGGGLRIAICAWESLHSIPVGGVAPHVTEIAAGLARRGNEVHLYTRAGHEGGSHNVVHDVRPFLPLLRLSCIIPP